MSSVRVETYDASQVLHSRQKHNSKTKLQHRHAPRLVFQPYIEGLVLEAVTGDQAVSVCCADTPVHRSIYMLEPASTAGGGGGSDPPQTSPA